MAVVVAVVQTDIRPVEQESTGMAAAIVPAVACVAAVDIAVGHIVLEAAQIARSSVVV